MSLALLFPGQGTQHPAMLPWLDAQPEAAATLALLAARIGADWRSRLADTGWATRNTVAQALLTGVSLAAWQCLAPRLNASTHAASMSMVMAGYSVGELPAFCAAGVFDAATALHLAEQRAQLMDASAAAEPVSDGDGDGDGNGASDGARTASNAPGGLLAVNGVTAPALASAMQRHGLSLAIRIAADRCVLGGAAAALDAAQAELTAAGAHVTGLAVQVASHTPGMAPAAAQFAALLAPLPFATPRALLVCNRSGAIERGEAALKHALAAQIDHTVQWQACQQSIAERGVRCVLEVGPGDSLSKLWNAAQPHIPSRSVDEFQGPAGVARWVESVLR